MILTQLKRHHGLQSQLCHRLEKIADALPASADRQECLALSRIVFKTVRQAHEFEETALFPRLRALQCVPDTRLEQNLERLRFEHWEDEAFAEELSDVLASYGRNGDPQEGEKLAWMLRGFFDGLRRHMAFEAEHLVPMLANETPGGTGRR